MKYLMETRAFYNKKKLEPQLTHDIFKPSHYDGQKIDTLEIKATLTCEKDLDELILYLERHRASIQTPGEYADHLTNFKINHETQLK